MTTVPQTNEPLIQLPSAKDLLTEVRMKATKLVPPIGAMKTIRLADSESSNAAQIATVISSDMRLATQILSLANSSAFAPVQPLTEIRAAVSRLGVKRVRNLVLATALSSVMKQLPVEVDWANEAINLHGRLTAVVATKLAGLLPVALQGEEFAAGLIHDIGRLTMFSLLGASALEVDALGFDEAEDPRIGERDKLGTDHSEIGALLLHSAGFPGSLLEVVHCHHSPEEATENPTLTAIVALADEIANRLQREDEAENLGSREHHVINVLCDANGWNHDEMLERVANADLGSAVDEAACMFG